MTDRTGFEFLIPDSSGFQGDTGAMKVYEGLDAVTAPYARSSVTIGNFDGVHRGHQALIRRAVEDARAHGRPAIVLTFDRHPRELFDPEQAARRLTTPVQRNALIAALSVDALIVARFDHGLAGLSADAFMTEILKGLLGAQAIVEGVDFCFGKGRAGDMAYLERVQGDYGFTLHTVSPVVVHGERASSTRVRERLLAGEMANAEAMLGHGFWLVGRVVRGQRFRRASGCLAANFDLHFPQITPESGSYLVQARLDDGRVWGGICTIGTGPVRCIQTYLFECNEELSGREMTLRFLRRLATGERIASRTAPTAMRDTLSAA